MASSATVIALNIASNDNAGALLEEEWEPVAVDSTTDVLPQCRRQHRRGHCISIDDRARFFFQHKTQRGTILSFTTRCSLKTDGPLNCAIASDSDDVG